MKPELLLLIGVHILEGISHHLGEVAFILLNLHRSLGHGAKLLSLLNEKLSGHVMVTKRPGKLLPSDARWVGMRVTVTVPPRSGGSFELVYY